MVPRYALALCLLVLPALVHAQELAPVMGPTLRRHIAEAPVQAQQATGFDDRVGVVITTDDAALLLREGIPLDARFDGIVTARLTPEELRRVAALPGVRHLDAPVEYPHNDVAAALTGATALREGLLGGTSYTGAGVIVCVIDSGIDWQHLDFRDPTDPTQTRIVALWDQLLVPQGGESSPAGYGYGVEYLAADIEAGLAGGTAPRSYDTNGHGTHVAGTAAGNGSSLSPARHVGMAPEADLVIVKAGDGSFSGTNVVNGISYCDQVATAQGKPAVLNMSLGSDKGPHDGTDYKSQVINSFSSKAGRVVVQSAGNSGASLIHATGTVAGGGTGTVTLTVPSYTAGPSADDFVLDVWFNGGTNVSVQVTSPNGHTATQTAGGSGFTSTPDGRVWLYNDTDGSNFDRYIEVEVDDGSGTAPVAGTWTIRFTNTTGTADTFHAWLTDASLTGATVTLAGANSDYSINNAAANGITVGSYVHRWAWSSSAGGSYNYVGTNLSDALSSFSSRGPSRDGQTLPHLTAPGQAMASSLSQYATVDNAYILPGGKHYVTQGTSMSSPVVAGLVALLLQYDPTLTGPQARQALTGAAYGDAYTGTLPNNAFGAGKVNAYAALARLVSGTTTPGFQVIAYDGARTSNVSVGNGVSVGVRFQQTLGHEGRVRGVLLHTGSTITTPGTVTFTLHADNGSGLPGTQLGSPVVVQTSTLARNTWNYVDLNSAGADVLSGTEYHVVAAMSATMHVAYENTSVSGRSTVNTGGGFGSYPVDWAIRPLVSSGASALPVELVVFEGVTEADRAVLTWMTASETNNAGFHVDVQRAGEAWNEVGFVAGNGTTARATRYRFETAGLAPGTYRFRLRQVDFDGVMTESDPVELTVEAQHVLALHLVGANPTAGPVRATFTTPRGGEARVELFDLMGRRVAVLFNGYAEAGVAHTARTPADHLAAGVYVVRLWHEGAQRTERVVVAR